mmetsp:Transcript_218/g.480  ORF Transcript_218/g.480 Transcript_218/m.480 type:complete len:243 (-) Transcript_218:3536-4264(-)
MPSDSTCHTRNSIPRFNRKNGSNWKFWTRRFLLFLLRVTRHRLSDSISGSFFRFCVRILDRVSKFFRFLETFTIRGFGQLSFALLFFVTFSFLYFIKIFSVAIAVFGLIPVNTSNNGTSFSKHRRSISAFHQRADSRLGRNFPINSEALHCTSPDFPSTVTQDPAIFDLPVISSFCLGNRERCGRIHSSFLPRCHERLRQNKLIIVDHSCNTAKQLYHCLTITRANRYGSSFGPYSARNSAS